MERPLGRLATIDFRSDADAMRMARSYPARVAASRRRAILTRTVELDVIPSLVLAKRATPSAAAPSQPACLVSAAEIAELVTLTLAPVELSAAGFLAGMRNRGVMPEALYLDLLAPAARRLGELWVEDECDFTEVTIGLWRLHNAMRELSPAFQRMSGAITGPSPRALLVPLPGEQHSFGLSMVFEFFQRAGWNAWTGPIATSGDLATMVGVDWVDVVGFSLACDERLETARAEIRAVRRASRNPGLAVMVGGPCFVTDPGLAAAIGADGTASDGLLAVSHARDLVARDFERR